MNLFTPPTLAATAIFACAILGPVVSASAQVSVDLNGTSQTWSSSLGFTSGYPTQHGSTGISPASVSLGGGLEMTLGYTVIGNAVPFTQNGSLTGNLNILDGSDPGISASPSLPSPVANGTTGFTLSIASEGADDNSGSLGHYVRYDFMFNQAVTVGDLIVIDIDALQLWNPIFSRNLPVFEDAVSIEGWSTASIGTPGSGVPFASSMGSNLSTSTLGGLDFVFADAPTGASAAATGGLVSSAESANSATFSSSELLHGFSIYYFDNLNNNIAYGGGMTLGLNNFEVTPAPEPSGALLAVLTGTLSLLRRRRKC